jgi:hypothetical protein
LSRKTAASKAHASTHTTEKDRRERRRKWVLTDLKEGHDDVVDEPDLELRQLQITMHVHEHGDGDLRVLLLTNLLGKLRADPPRPLDALRPRVCDVREVHRVEDSVAHICAIRVFVRRETLFGFEHGDRVRMLAHVCMQDRLADDATRLVPLLRVELLEDVAARLLETLECRPRVQVL